MLGAYLHSFILAKALGLYMIVMAIVMITRADYYKNILQHIEREKLATLSGASFGLVLGLLLISVHNLWAWQPYVVMTIVGWVLVIKSVLWMAIPEKMAKAFHEIYSGKLYYVIAILIGCLGIWILGYAVFHFGGPFPVMVDVLPD